MRNLPPRMSNQPARKWEFELPNETYASFNEAFKESFKKAFASLKPKRKRKTPISVRLGDKYTVRNHKIYDDIGSKIAYRGVSSVGQPRF